MLSFQQFLEARIHNPEFVNYTGSNNYQSDTYNFWQAMYGLAKNSCVSFALHAVLLVKNLASDEAKDAVEQGILEIDNYLSNNTTMSQLRLAVSGLSDYAHIDLVARAAYSAVSACISNYRSNSAYAAQSVLGLNPGVKDDLVAYLRYLMPKQQNNFNHKNINSTVVDTLKTIVSRPDHEITNDDIGDIHRILVDEYEIEDEFNWTKEGTNSVYRNPGKHRLLQTIRREFGND